MFSKIWEFYKEYAFIAFVLFLVGLSVYKLVRGQNTEWVKSLPIVLAISIVIIAIVALVIIRK